MFYSSGLENLILTRHLQNSSDELLILSGWTGPSPLIKLSNLPIKTTVIRGIQTNLSKDLASYINIANTTQTDIYIYSKNWRRISQGSFKTERVEGQNLRQIS